jgi:hypothetical protein
LPARSLKQDEQRETSYNVGRWENILTVGKKQNSKGRKIKANVRVKEKEMAIKLMKIRSTFHEDAGKLERYSKFGISVHTGC